MRKHIFDALKALTAWAVLAISVAYAQSSKIVATVPFDFVVADQNMEQGKYTFTIDLLQTSVLVRGQGNDSAAFALSHAASAENIHQEARVVFNRYGDRYFLSQVWTVGMADGRELPQSSKERELAKNSGKPAIVALIVKAPGLSKVAR